MNAQNDELPNSNLVSRVIATETIDENEKRITIEIPLLYWPPVTITWTLGEIVKFRKELEIEWKIDAVSNHDYITANNLMDSADMTRWEYGSRWGSFVIDTKAAREKKKLAEAKQKKLVEDLKQSVRDWHATLISTGEHSKKALFEIFIVSEEKISQLFSKKNMIKAWKVLSKTWDAIWDFIEKWIYYVMPTIEWTLPQIKKQIFMTWNQLFDILHGKKVVSNSSDKKEDIKQTDEVQ